MPAQPGFDVAVYITDMDQSTATTGEATSNTSGNVYQVDDLSKRIIDPDVTPTVYENGTPTGQTVTIDNLFGKITFPSAPTEPVTVDYNYYPRFEVACARGIEVIEKRANLDRTCFQHGGPGVRKRFLGQFDASGSVEHLDVTTDLIGTDRLREVFAGHSDNEITVLEWTIGTHEVFRAFVVFEELRSQGSLDDVIQGNFSWNLAAIDDAGFFGWSDYRA